MGNSTREADNTTEKFLKFLQMKYDMKIWKALKIIHSIHAKKNLQTFLKTLQSVKL